MLTLTVFIFESDLKTHGALFFLLCVLFGHETEFQEKEPQ